jgi:hypothetical protein
MLFNAIKLKTEETRTQFQRKIQQLIDELGIETTDVNELVSQNSEIVITAADEILGLKPQCSRSDWFDDECKTAVEERKAARLTANTRRKKLAYKQKQIQVYRLLRRKKREKLNQEIENLEAHNRNGNV